MTQEPKVQNIATEISQQTSVFKKLYDPDIPFHKLHTSKFVEIGLVVSGTGVLRVLDQEIPCGVGDLFILHPNATYGYFSADKNDDLTVRLLRFDASAWFDGLIANPESPRFCHGVFSDNPFVTYAVLNSHTQYEVNAFNNAIALELEWQKAEWREAVRAHLSMLLITIHRYMGSAIKGSISEFPKSWGVISAVVRLIDERVADGELSLSSIADDLYLSPSYLSRLFKQYTGETFTDYLHKSRVKAACKLLKDTDIAVKEIALMCGHKDLPTFYHIFYTCKGVTPSQYRTEKRKIIINKGETLMSLYNEISENLQKGKAKIVKELVQQAIDSGAKAEEILNEGLMHGMNIIGEKFKNNEIYVPEVLVAARAMNMGAQILKPYLAASGVQATGKVCIGTVQGDLHDIGKNLVKMMLEGKGLEVVDLGTDVPAEVFVKTAKEQNCQVICCSALLTTTMGVMADVVKIAEAEGIRDSVKIMVGGAPVNEAFCREIGADCYTSDAASAADAAVAFCKA